MNTRTPTSFDYSKQNLDILKTQAQLQSNMPGEYDADAWAMGELRSLGQKRKPASGWHALLDGMMIGAESNMKKQKYEKLRGELQIYSDYANSMREKNEWFEKRGQFLEQATPYAESLYSIANSKMDESMKQQYISDLMKQYQSVNPEAGKYDIVAAPSGADFFIQVDRATGEKKMTPYSSMMTPDGWQDLQKRNLENLKIDIQKQNADIYGRSVNSNVDYHNAQIKNMPNVQAVREKEANTAAENSNTRKANLIHKTVGEELDAKKEFLRDAPRIIEVIERNPKIFQSLAQIQWANQDPSYFETITRNLADQFRNPQDKEDVAYLTKAFQKLKINSFKGFVRPNQFLEKTAAGSVPNFGLPPATAKKLLKEMMGDAEFDVQKYEGRIKAIDNEEGKLANAWINSPQPQQTPQGMSQGNGGMIKFKNPNTGKIVELPQSKQNEAINMGFIFIG